MNEKNEKVSFLSSSRVNSLQDRHAIVVGGAQPHEPLWMPLQKFVHRGPFSGFGFHAFEELLLNWFSSVPLCALVVTHE